MMARKTIKELEAELAKLREINAGQRADVTAMEDIRRRDAEQTELIHDKLQVSEQQNVEYRAQIVSLKEQLLVMSTQHDQLDQMYKYLLGEVLDKIGR